MENPILVIVWARSLPVTRVQKQPGLMGTETKLHYSVMGPLLLSPTVPKLVGVLVVVARDTAVLVELSTDLLWTCQYLLTLCKNTALLGWG